MGNKKVRKRMLFAYRHMATFIKDEITILSKHYDLEIFQFGGPFSLLKLFFAIRRNDAVYVYFEHSYAAICVFFANLLGKKSIIHTAGAVVLNHGWEHYKEVGLKRGLLRKFLPIYAVGHATLSLPVSNYKKTGILKYVKPRKIIVVENGVNHLRFKPGKMKRENKVVTISAIDTTCLKRKGLETLVKVAKNMPNTNFKIIGKIADKKSYDALKSISPKNVIITGEISDDELLHELRTAKVYVQLSLYESFGVALAEAMLCECIPVIVNASSLPEVAGSIGYKVPYGDINKTTEAVKSALHSNTGKRARDRILKNYTLEIREKKLINAIETVL